MNCFFVKDFLRIVNGEFICIADGQRIQDKEFDLDIYKNYIVSSIGVEEQKIVIELKPYSAVVDPNAEWVKEYKQQYGVEPSFFLKEKDGQDEMKCIEVLLKD